MQQLKYLNVFGLLFFFILLILINSCEKEYEKIITKEDLPQVVLDAFTAGYPEASVTGYTEEAEDGKIYYEISFELEGRKIDILYNVEGVVVELEKTISAEEMPDLIQEAIAKEITEYSLIRIEKVQKEGKFFYEAKILNTKNDKKYELFFSESGELLEKETMEEEEE
ncbi:hypothetical protein ACFL6A_01810 [bacterium]